MRPRRSVTAPRSGPWRRRIQFAHPAAHARFAAYARMAAPAQGIGTDFRSAAAISFGAADVCGVARPQAMTDDGRQHGLQVFRQHARVAVQEGPGLRGTQQRDHGARRQPGLVPADRRARRARAPARSRAARRSRGPPTTRCCSAGIAAGSRTAGRSRAGRGGRARAGAGARVRAPGSRARSASGNGRSAIRAAGRCRPGTTGFWVATMKNGSGSACDSPSIVTWRSSIASSNALCAFGVARLTSSAITSWANTGPRWNLKRPLARS